jgi:hypothetical protein
VLYYHPSQWDLRAIALSPDVKRFQRFVDKAIDECWLKVYDLQTKYANVTQGVVLINLEGK